MTDNVTVVNLVVETSSYIWLVGLVLAFAFTILALMTKAALVWLAAMICWIGAYLEIPLTDTYYNVGIGIMALFCLMMATWRYQTKRGKYG